MIGDGSSAEGHVTCLADSLDKDFHRLADEFTVGFFSIAVRIFHESSETLSNNILRNLVIKGCCLRTRSRRILESKCGVELSLFDRIKCLLEIFFGLSGETYDNVSRK